MDFSLHHVAPPQKMAVPMESHVPESVVRFIASFIHSLEQLEILLLLAAPPSREWTVNEVYKVVRSSEGSVAERLKDMKACGLLVSNSSSDPTYRFMPKNPDLARCTELLAHEYKERRVKIVELIYAPKVEPLKGFADAFRFKRDK